MDTWIWIALAAAVAAMAAPLVMRSLGRRNPEKTESERREQQDVLAQATDVLENMVRVLREGDRVPTGPGSPVHGSVGQLRPRIRKLFTLSAASEFDREIGFELNRPGFLTLGVQAVEGRVERALRALRNAISG